jgi:hypothetical protein
MPEDILPIDLEKRIYKSSHILVATFFGGPLAATYMLAMNFRQMGLPEKFKKTWIWGSFAIILFFFLAFIIPDSKHIPSLALPLACLAAASTTTKYTQQSEIQKHIDEGGFTYSVWRAIAIGLISLVITLAVIVMILLALDQFFGWDPSL